MVTERRSRDSEDQEFSRPEGCAVLDAVDRQFGQWRPLFPSLLSLDFAKTWNNLSNSGLGLILLKHG